MKRLEDIEAILFDLDGTLIDIYERELNAIKDTASHFGVRVSIVEVKRLFDRLSMKPHALRLDLFSDIFEALGLTFSDQSLNI